MPGGCEGVRACVCVCVCVRLLPCLPFICSAFAFCSHNWAVVTSAMKWQIPIWAIIHVSYWMHIRSLCLCMFECACVWDRVLWPTAVSLRKQKEPCCFMPLCSFIYVRSVVHMLCTLTGEKGAGERERLVELKGQVLAHAESNWWRRWFLVSFSRPL